MTNFNYLITLIFFTMIMSCSSPGQKLAEGVSYPDPENFSTVLNGNQVSLYTLTNKNGVRVDITNYGGRIVSLMVPDKDGVFDDVVTGYHSIDEFVHSTEAYFGAIIGRYGNRIANAAFSIDGETFKLAANNGPNNLHGGPGGFHNVVWDAEQIDNRTLKLKYLSPHMEEGFPGNLDVTVIYSLNDHNELRIEYTAITDQATVVNLTNHAFFNLGGEGDKTINDHILKIHAAHYTPVDETLIPTGEIAPVEGTPFDFREYRRIGDRVDAGHQQIAFGKGYDHNFVLGKAEGTSGLQWAASVYEPSSMRMMEVLTTEPGMQFYGGNFLRGVEVGKRGETYLHRTSFCLETQHFPDSPNQPGFPSTLLRPGEKYQTTTIYRFSVKKD